MSESLLQRDILKANAIEIMHFLLIAPMQIGKITLYEMSKFEEELDLGIHFLAPKSTGSYLT